MFTPVQLSSNSAATTIDMNTTQVMEAAGEAGTSKQLARLLFIFGFLTLLMDLATALYKPPSGVVFESHKRAYYLTLAGIFAAGLAEVSTAFCLSVGSSGESIGRLRAFARVVLCASVVPLAAVIALGGYAVLIKG
ncbi:uncharacterized protein LOC133917106 [Phragmites australis]|uniref:uncharacterized protein LOC133917106 n=1 Tax=Phragmites australis TaxID=29695 RepID=UPI002D76E42F|nr:uncharacterized protein LOC133917106 [Phragmites australis]